MTSPSLPLTKKEYRYIGIELARQNPDLALSILKGPDKEPPTPDYTDLSLMPGFLDRFCAFIHVSPEDFIGSLRKPHRVDERRQFIAAMVHFYNPQVYDQSSDNLLFCYRFVKSLAETLHIDEGNTSKAIREVILREKIYADFSERVQVTIMAIKIMEVSDGGA